MESGSPSANVPDRPANRFAAVLGTLVALVTLILPVVIIAYYSSDSNSQTAPSPTYRLGRMRE